MPHSLSTLLAGRRGHFRMESGYHSEWWYDLDRLFSAPGQLRPFVSELAARLARHGVEVVCGPQTGGAKLARMIADELRIESVVSERREHSEATGLFPVDYVVTDETCARVRSKAVALIDDAISAGSAVRGTLRSLHACGARPVALGALIVFGDRAAHFAQEQKLPLESVTALPFTMWSPTECPLCAAGVPCERV